MPERPGKQRRRNVPCAANADIGSRFNAILAAVRRDSNQHHYDIHTNTIQFPQSLQPTHARWENAQGEGVVGPSVDEDEDDQELSVFSNQLDPVYPRNFMIHDIYLSGAPESRFGPPGPDNDPRSLSSIPDDILDELPLDCRRAVEQAQSSEKSWRSQWSTESMDGKRGKFLPTVEWFP